MNSSGCRVLSAVMYTRICKRGIERMQLSAYAATGLWLCGPFMEAI